jgi:drug/metabolite transporter (DMT)-like permease
MDALSPAILLALASGCCWSIFDLQRRFLVERMTAWSLVVWVTLPALPLVLIWAWLAADWRFAMPYLLPGGGSVLFNIAANFFFFRAIQLSPLSVTLPMLSLTPVFTALLGALVLGERLGSRHGMGIALVVAGAWILSTGASGLRFAARRIEHGSLFMGVVALCWSATMMLDKQALAHAAAPLHALLLNAGVAVGGVAALAARGKLVELATARRNLGLLALATTIGVAALGSQLVAIQTVPIGIVETLKRGIGAGLAVVWGRAFFAEPVTGWKLLAVALSTAGVAALLL